LNPNFSLTGEFTYKPLAREEKRLISTNLPDAIREPFGKSNNVPSINN
jgi:hypothetical protein